MALRGLLILNPAFPSGRQSLGILCQRHGGPGAAILQEASHGTPHHHVIYLELPFNLSSKGHPFNAALRLQVFDPIGSVGSVCVM